MTKTEGGKRDMGEGVTGWCADHKRDKPCILCEKFLSEMNKLMELSPKQREAMFRPVWEVDPVKSS